MDLTKITTPFGLLDAETQGALRDYHRVGGVIELYHGNGWRERVGGNFADTFVYRAKQLPKRGEATFTGSRRAYFSIFSGRAECYDSYPDRLRFTFPTDDDLIRPGVYTDADGRKVIIEEIGAATDA